jgi:hypothetical protein
MAEETVKPNRDCVHVKANGDTCGAYALRDSDLCFWHHKARVSREQRVKSIAREGVKPSGIVLPLLEDANSVQVAIQMVAQAAADRRITRAESGMLLYSIQLAIMNLKNVKLAETVRQTYVREIPNEGDEFEDRCESEEIPLEEDPEFRDRRVEQLEECDEDGGDEDAEEDEVEENAEESENVWEFVAANLDRVKKLLPGRLEGLGIVET